MSVNEYRLEAGVGKPNTFWVATTNGYNLIVYPDRVVINRQIAGEQVHLLVDGDVLRHLRNGIDFVLKGLCRAAE